MTNKISPNQIMEAKKEIISDYIKRSIQTKIEVSKNKVEIIDKISKEIIDALKRGNKVMWFGNGGSAADAQHLACELVSKFYLERKALASIALTTNTSELTAIANDYDFNRVFARQIEALTHPQDVVVGITTSGNSPNVIEGIKEAKRRGAIAIVLTGASGKKFKGYADYILTISSKETSHIQECHIMIGHIICYIVEKELFGDKNEK